MRLKKMTKCSNINDKNGKKICSEIVTTHQTFGLLNANTIGLSKST